jgi:hypothetical protein
LGYDFDSRIFTGQFFKNCERAVRRKVVYTYQFDLKLDRRFKDAPDNGPQGTGFVEHGH